ncbi:hypothetical protein ACFL2R_00620 [Patescibacteria group bacterium]
MNNLTNREVSNIFSELVRSFGFRNLGKDDWDQMADFYEKGDYSECAWFIMRLFGIKAFVSIYAIEKWSRKKSKAYVRVNDTVPHFDSLEFEGEEFEIFVSKSSLELSLETFVYIIGHELAHIFLYAQNHELRESEIATDILLICFGFKKVKGILSFGDKSVGVYGYLKVSQFYYLCYKSSVQLMNSSADDKEIRINSLKSGVRNYLGHLLFRLLEYSIPYS